MASKPSAEMRFVPVTERDCREGQHSAMERRLSSEKFGHDSMVIVFIPKSKPVSSSTVMDNYEAVKRIFFNHDIEVKKGIKLGFLV